MDGQNGGYYTHTPSFGPRLDEFESQEERDV